MVRYVEVSSQAHKASAMRVQSAADFAGKRRGGAPKQKIPGEGTQVRALWDLMQAHKGVIIDAPLTIIFPNSYIEILRNIYGLDIRNLGATSRGIGEGKGRGHSRWILAGEWFGKEYVDYISRNKKKLDKVSKLSCKELGLQPTPTLGGKMP